VSQDIRDIFAFVSSTVKEFRSAVFYFLLFKWTLNINTHCALFQTHQIYGCERG